MAELVGGVVGGEGVVVEALGGAAADDGAAAGFEAEAHIAGHGSLGGVDEGVEGLAERGEPEAVVDELGVARLEARLFAEEVPFEGDRFEVGVGEDEREGAGAFVDLAALDADAAVLDHVDAAPAVPADGFGGGGDELGEGHRLAVEGDGDACCEGDGELPRLVGDVSGVGGEGVRLAGRCGPGIFDDATFDGASPEVLVDGVRVVAADFHGDVVACGVVDGVLAAEPPETHGGEDVEVGGEGADGDLEADLVVAFAGAAVRDGVCVVLEGGGDEVADDDGSGERGDERVLAFVEGVGAEGREAVLVGELVAGVDDEGFDGAGGARAGADGVPVVVGVLADIDGEGDDVDVPFVVHPFDGDGGVEAAGVGEDDAAGLVGAHRLVGSEAGEGGEFGGDVGAAGVFGADDDEGVVTGDVAEDVGEAGPVEGGADDVRRAGRCAEDDEVVAVGDLDDEVAHDAAEVVVGGGGFFGVLGEGVGHGAPGDADFEGSELLEVAADGGLGGDDAVGGEELDDLGLAGDGLLLEEAGDAVLALRFAEGGHQRAPMSSASRARVACMRFSACCQTTDRGPSRTSAVTSSPRWAGRQWRR